MQGEILIFSFLCYERESVLLLSLYYARMFLNEKKGKNKKAVSSQ